MQDILEPVAPPTTKFGVNPNSALVNRFNEATANSDIQDTKSLIPLAIGTTLEPQIQNSLKVMEGGIAPMQSILQQANAKGGIGTPEGNIAASDEISKWAKFKPETGFWKGIAGSLMGVPDSWRMMTQGQVASGIEYDKAGKGAFATYAQNNPNAPLSIVDSQTGQPIGPTEYADRGFHLFKDPSSSPFVQGEGEVYKKNANEYQKTAARTNIAAAVYPTIAQNSAQAEGLMTDIASKYNLSNEQLNQLHAITSKVMSTESMISEAFNTMNQGMSTDSKRQGFEQLKSLTGGAGFGGLHMDAGGKIVDSNGNNKSAQDMVQIVKDHMNKNGLSAQYNQSMQELKNSAVYQSLPTVEDKAKLEQAMNLIQSNHVKINEIKSSTLGELPFLTTSIPHKLGDPFQVGIISNMFDQANAEKVAAWSDYLTNESKKYGNNPPTQGQLEAAFARTANDPTSILSQINNKWASKIKEVEARTYPEIKTPLPVGSNISGANLAPKKSVETVPEKKKDQTKKLSAGDEFLNSLK